jgi:hypothetical protein
MSRSAPGFPLDGCSLGPLFLRLIRGLLRQRLVETRFDGRGNGIANRFRDRRRRFISGQVRGLVWIVGCAHHVALPNRSGGTEWAAIPIPPSPSNVTGRISACLPKVCRTSAEPHASPFSAQPAIRPTSRGSSECFARRRRAAAATPSGTHRSRATCFRISPSSA